MRQLKSTLLPRASWSFHVQRFHLILGSAITVGTVLAIAILVQAYWILQASLITRVLGFARVPHELFLPRPAFGVFLNAIAPEFLLEKAVISETLILLAAIAILLAIAVIAVVPRLSPPSRILAIFFLALVLVNLAYGILHPEQPWPLRVDWLTSGIVIIPLIALVFNVTVFPIPGSLSTKLVGLLACLAFSFVWSTLRLSLALSSLFYLGAFSFMFLEYLPGAFVDFVYMLLFYSLVMRRLAASHLEEARSIRRS